MKKIGLFGVTANPPHLGHVAVVNQALEKCDEVWLSPVYIHPFGKSFIDYTHRLQMLKIIFNFNERIKLKELDKEFYEKFTKTPYSYELLSYVKNNYVGLIPQLIIGQDNYKPEVWKKFYNSDKIVSEFGVIVIEDKGAHSTEIRTLCEQGKWNEVQSLCGDKVAQYLKANELYQIKQLEI